MTRMQRSSLGEAFIYGRMRSSNERSEPRRQREKVANETTRSSTRPFSNAISEGTGASVQSGAWCSTSAHCRVGAPGNMDFLASCCWN